MLVKTTEADISAINFLKQKEGLAFAHPEQMSPEFRKRETTTHLAPSHSESSKLVPTAL